MHLHRASFAAMAASIPPSEPEPSPTFSRRRLPLVKINPGPVTDEDLMDNLMI